MPWYESFAFILKTFKVPFWSRNLLYFSFYITYLLYFFFLFTLLFLLECQLVDWSFKFLLPNFPYLLLFVILSERFSSIDFFQPLRFYFSGDLSCSIFILKWKFYPPLVLWKQYLSYHYKNISFGLPFEVLCSIICFSVFTLSICLFLSLISQRKLPTIFCCSLVTVHIDKRHMPMKKTVGSSV